MDKPPSLVSKRTPRPLPGKQPMRCGPYCREPGPTLSSTMAAAREQRDTADDEPPITGASLAKLDMPRIINNPKLRHDVNFDRELHFRPNLDNSNGRRKIAEAERYWERVGVEFMTLAARSRAASSQGLQNDVLSSVNVSSGSKSKPPSSDADSSRFGQHRSDGDNRREGLIELVANSRYPGLILTPDSSPISQEQLGAEVKRIYAGLVMVEAKCINIDAAQAADPSKSFSSEQWEALIALHRTLLYEHHDFLMATQHPSASPSLRNLASKYQMPARMRKHGIHALLELLRDKRPGSLDHRNSFIYLACQMMALLMETVPAFTETWIECLANLARYRMAVEGELGETWAGVAGRWYTKASDRDPAIGRLYHHLDILERPIRGRSYLHSGTLAYRNLLPYAKALSTLCGPIVQDEQTFQSSGHSVGARLSTCHDLQYSISGQTTIDTTGPEAPGSLHKQHFTNYGTSLAVTNIAALFEPATLFPNSADALNRMMRNIFPLLTKPFAESTGQSSGCSFENVSPMDDAPRPLSEDFWTRGHIWARSYLPAGWFLDINVEDTATEHYVLSELGASQAEFKARAKNDPPTPTSLHSILNSRKLRRILKPLGQYLTLAGLLSCAQAAPIRPTALNHTSVVPQEPLLEWSGSIEHKTLLILNLAIALGSSANVIQINIRKPAALPKMSGDLAFGFSLAAWGLLETAPELTDWRNLLLAVWLAAESDFMARMCCLVRNGRVYLWGSIGFGLFATMFTAALQSDARPTLSSMLAMGLPSAAFFLTCAARVLPKAVGMR